jgi:hypothetical protein
MYGVPARKYSLSDRHFARGQFLKKRARQAVKASFFLSLSNVGVATWEGPTRYAKVQQERLFFFLFSLLIDFYGENQVEIVSQVAKVFCYGPGSSEGILKIHSM